MKSLNGLLNFTQISQEEVFAVTRNPILVTAGKPRVNLILDFY